MSSLQQALYETLGQHSGVNAIVGARIYPKIAPQGAALPRLVWQEFSVRPENGLDGFHSLANYRLQITSQALTALAAQTLDAQVRAALAAATQFASLWRDQRSLPYDADRKIHALQSDFSMWYRT